MSDKDTSDKEEWVDPFEEAPAKPVKTQSEVKAETKPVTKSAHRPEPDADPQTDNPQRTIADLPQVLTLANGEAPKFIWMTELICPTCKGGSGGSRLGALKDLGGGSWTLECENTSCAQTVHGHMSQFSLRDQRLAREKSTRR